MLRKRKLFQPPAWGFEKVNEGSKLRGYPLNAFLGKKKSIEYSPNEEERKGGTAGRFTEHLGTKDLRKATLAEITSRRVRRGGKRGIGG